MNLALLVGDHALRAPRARDSVATLLAALLPDDWVVLDRTLAGGSRAITDLAIGSLVDLDRIRSAAESAHLLVSMSVGDLGGGGCNPHDWLRRWLRISSTATRLGWKPTLVRIDHGETSNRDTRRFERRLAETLDTAGVSPLSIDASGWPAPLDPGSDGASRIAADLRRSLVPTATREPVIIRRRTAPSSLAE
jgi:hypothetical protein